MALFFICHLLIEFLLDRCKTANGSHGKNCRNFVKADLVNVYILLL